MTYHLTGARDARIRMRRHVGLDLFKSFIQASLPHLRLLIARDDHYHTNGATVMQFIRMRSYLEADLRYFKPTSFNTE